MTYPLHDLEGHDPSVLEPKEITRDEFIRICWDAFTNGELSTLTQKEIDKSLQPIPIDWIVE